MAEKNTGLSAVPGFTFSSVRAGIRYNDRYDYCIIKADGPCTASGVFTTNKVNAAPVKLCRRRINNPIQAIVINATNANACTGKEGLENAEKLTADMASRLAINDNAVLMCSTGIIGHQLPLEKMMAAHDEMIKQLSTKTGDLVAQSIMTTDTVPKETSAVFKTTKGTYTIAGTAKGSGMISPDMATMLAFIITDAPVSKPDLDRIFKKTAGDTFNALTIDGDTSTNDSAIILSPVSHDNLSSDADLSSFEKALLGIMSELSMMIVQDGEGVTKTVNVTVTGAKNDIEARTIAKSVAESLLVKTAIFGRDPNWGRIACAAGYSGAAIDETRLSIFFDDIQLLKNGTPCVTDTKKLKKIMEKDLYAIIIDAGLAEGTAHCLTTDLTYDYIRINAEYST